MPDKLKEIPLDGKVTGFKEDTVWGGGAFASRRDLRTMLIIKNEILGLNHYVAFVRSGQPGDILSALINDFKTGQELKVKGKISYYLGDPMALFGAQGDFKKVIKRVKYLAKVTDWQQISEDDKTALREFLSRIIAPYSGEVHFNILLGDKVKYVIYADEWTIGSADIFLQ